MSTPIEQLDKTSGLRLVSGDGTDVRLTRYLFMAGDIIPPERKDRLSGGLEHLSPGGAEVEARCLRRTPNFVPRAVLTPLEIWPNPMPSEFLPDGFPTELLLQVEGETEGQAEPFRASARVLRGRTLVGYPMYPGHDVSSIISEHTGIVEVRPLLGIEWDKGYVQNLQQEFFPTPPPIELSKLQFSIEEKRNSYSEVVNDMLASCDLFKRWAEWRLRVEHTLLAQRVSRVGDHVYTYSTLAGQLLKQLEMTPQDQGFQHLMAQSQNMIAEAIRSVGGQQPQQAVSPELIASIVKAVMEATAPPKTVAEVKATKPPVIEEEDGNN